MNGINEASQWKLGVSKVWDGEEYGKRRRENILYGENSLWKTGAASEEILYMNIDFFFLISIQKNTKGKNLNTHNLVTNIGFSKFFIVVFP